MNSYSVLGIHNTAGTEEPNVVRLRMFVGGEAIDEDLPLPKPVSVDEQIDQAARARVAEIEKNVSPQDSELTFEDGNRTVNTKFATPSDNVEVA